MSLDAGDDDPVRFWVYVVEALQAVTPGLGEAVLGPRVTPTRAASGNQGFRIGAGGAGALA